MTAKIKTTIRLPFDLDESLKIYAKAEDISKNQAVKKAIRILVEQASKKTK